MWLPSGKTAFKKEIKSIYLSGLSSSCLLETKGNGCVHLNACNVWLCSGGGLCILYFPHIPAPFSQLSPQTHSHCSTLQGPCCSIVYANVTLAKRNYGKYCVFKSMDTHIHTFTTVAHGRTWAHLARHWGSSSSMWPSTGHLWRINPF